MNAAELFKILTGREIDSRRKFKQGKMIMIYAFHPKKDTTIRYLLNKELISKIDISFK